MSATHSYRMRSPALILLICGASLQTAVGFAGLPTASRRLSLFPRSSLRMFKDVKTGARVGGNFGTQRVKSDAMQHLQRMKRPPSSERLSELLGDGVYNQRDIGSMMGELKKQRRWQTVLALLGFAERLPSGANTVMYNTAISACGQARQWMHALQVFGRMRKAGVEQNVISWNAAMSACERAGEVEKAMSIFQRMREAGVSPTEASYNIAISACAKGNMLSEATALMASMEHDGVPASTLTRNAMLNVYVKAGESQAAWRVFEQLKREGAADVWTYTTIISGCPRGLGLSLLREMQASGLESSTVLYNAAMNSCSKAGQWETALELLSEMSAHKLQPNLVTFNTAITACEKGGQWQQAMQIMTEQMPHAGISPDVITYGAAISACGKGGQWMEALRLLREMQEGGLHPNEVIFGAAIGACANAAQWEESLALLSTAMEEAQVTPNGKCYNAAIHACAKAGRPNEAIDLLQKMTDAGVAPDGVSYSTAIQACEKAGEASLALQLMSHMRWIGVEPTDRAYSAAISACEKGGRWGEAMGLLEDIRERGLEMDIIGTKAAIMTCCKAGEVDMALSLLATVDLDALGEEAYSVYWALSQACGRLGMEETASRLEKEMRERGMSSSTKVAQASWTVGRRRARSPARSPAGHREEQEDGGPIRSGDAGDTLSSMCHQLVQQLVSKTEYEFDTTALPYLFVRNSTVQKQHTSLTYHCDKKALAAALSEVEGDEQVEVKVNIKMCADCHNAFKHASALFGRTVACEDGSHHHVFQGGRCSCNDMWR